MTYGIQIQIMRCSNMVYTILNMDDARHMCSKFHQNFRRWTYLRLSNSL